MCITLDDVEKILKNNHIFNDVILALKPRIIKVSPKLDIAIIWIDIWDTQSRSKAKTLINKRFNVGRFIATVQDTNMNLGVPQCKNCWKWGHFADVCRIQGAKYIKCNSLHQTIYYYKFAWCYKANNKINLPRLEMKKGKPYPH